MINDKNNVFTYQICLKENIGYIYVYVLLFLTILFKDNGHSENPYNDFIFAMVELRFMSITTKQYLVVLESLIVLIIE